MNQKLKIGLVTVIVGFLALMLAGNSPIGQVIWPPNEHGPEAEGAIIGLFIAYTFYASITFGLAVAVLGVAWKPFQRLARVRGRAAWFAYASLGWLLLSWLPHDNLHMSLGESSAGALVALEWGFHATMIAAALFVTVFLIGTIDALARPRLPAARTRAREGQAPTSGRV